MAVITSLLLPRSPDCELAVALASVASTVSDWSADGSTPSAETIISTMRKAANAIKMNDRMLRKTFLASTKTVLKMSNVTTRLLICMWFKLWPMRRKEQESAKFWIHQPFLLSCEMNLLSFHFFSPLFFQQGIGVGAWVCGVSCGVCKRFVRLIAGQVISTINCD